MLLPTNSQNEFFNLRLPEHSTFKKLITKIYPEYHIFITKMYLCLHLHKINLPIIF